jgi:hypothetical protein
MLPSENSSTSVAPIRLGIGANIGLSIPARPTASQIASRITNAVSWRAQA